VRDRLLLALGLALALGAVGGSVAREEIALARSEIVYLPLAPVDPRSLVQGDFMRLEYRIARDLERGRTGTVVVALDELRVARFVRWDDGGPLAPDERRLQVGERSGRPFVASRAFLFQEGTAGTYERARYGEIALTPEGRATLVGLAGEYLAHLGQPLRRW